MLTLLKRKIATKCKADIIGTIKTIRKGYTDQGVKTTSAYQTCKNHTNIYIYQMEHTEPKERPNKYKPREPETKPRKQYAKREPETKPRKQYAKREPETKPRKQYAKRKPETKPRKGGGGRQPKYLITQKINLDDMIKILNATESVQITKSELLDKFKLHAMESLNIDKSLLDDVHLDIDAVEICTPILNNTELKSVSDRLKKKGVPHIVEDDSQSPSEDSPEEESE